MDDRLRYKCAKCKKEILVASNQPDPICCNQPMYIVPNQKYFKLYTKNKNFKQIKGKNRNYDEEKLEIFEDENLKKM